MKRSELKVGEAYYYDRSTAWEDARYGEGRKAVVVDDKRYAIRKVTFGFRYDERYAESPKGNAVLVDVYSEGSDKPSRTAVPAAHLRGPWEQTLAEVTARRAASIEREAVRRSAETELHRRAETATERAASLGVKVDARYGYGVHETRIELSVEEFERLLDMANAARVAGIPTDER